MTPTESVAADPTGEPAMSRGDGDTPRGRPLRRHHALPTGRAVAGALLVAGAAVGVFAAYLDASATPSTRYLVAAQPLAPGTIIEDRAAVTANFASVAMDLPADQARTAVAEAELDMLVGTVAVGPVDDGALAQHATFIDATEHPGTHVVSFAIARRDALGGALATGRAVDIVATYTRGQDAYTEYVVRDVPVLDVTARDDGGIGTTELVLTVAVESPGDVMALGHAVRTASVFLSAPPTGGDDEDPGFYRPDLPPPPVVPIPDEGVPDFDGVPPVVTGTPAGGPGDATGVGPSAGSTQAGENVDG